MLLGFFNKNNKPNLVVGRLLRVIFDGRILSRGRAIKRVKIKCGYTPAVVFLLFCCNFNDFLYKRF